MLGAVYDSDIHAMLADGRDDIVSDPAFECLGLRLAGSEDEGVQAGFVDDRHVEVASITVG